MRRIHYILIVLIATASGASYVVSNQPKPAQPISQPENQPVAPIANPVPSPVSTACDPGLWNFVYHPDRLPTKNDCRSVSGIVQWDKIEPDGDYHIRLQLDDPNSAPVNAKNIGGYLVVEPICQKTPTQADATGPCASYSGPHFSLPTVGSHIQVSGFYTLDAQHGWMEIHSVYNLEAIQ